MLLLLLWISAAVLVVPTKLQLHLFCMCLQSLDLIVKHLNLFYKVVVTATHSLSLPTGLHAVVAPVRSERVVVETTLAGVINSIYGALDSVQRLLIDAKRAWDGSRCVD
jgi:hypothetical protein